MNLEIRHGKQLPGFITADGVPAHGPIVDGLYYTPGEPGWMSVKDAAEMLARAHSVLEEFCARDAAPPPDKAVEAPAPAVSEPKKKK